MEVKSKARKRQVQRAINTSKKDHVSKDICFVIMPFGGWLDDYYETIYCPAIIAAGLEPHRADDLYRPSTIVNDIWAYTKRAKLLVADLTGKNANVFYELGLAHALAKPVILVAGSMDDIPFDLRALRIIVYDKNDPMWGERLKEKIQSSIREVLQSPQEAVLPAFLSVKETSDKVTVSSHQKEIIEIKQELELLRREMRFKGTIDYLPQNRPLSSEMEAIGTLRNYFKMGLCKESMEKAFIRRGFPKEWIDLSWEEIQNELRKPRCYEADLHAAATAITNKKTL